MKILILGANGSIGAYLTDFFNNYKDEFDIIALDKDTLDITEKGNVLYTIKDILPDVVIHAAGISNVDFCEYNEDASYNVNTFGTLNIASACSMLNLPLIYISSSYVYGESEDYNGFLEDSPCKPINIYGKCKLAGEELIRTLCKRFFIFRTSWNFGGDDCYVKKIITNKDTPLMVSSLEVVNPTDLKDLANAIKLALNSEAYGVYNIASKNFVSKIDTINYIFNLLNIDKTVIPLPDDVKKNIAVRPNFSALDSGLFEKTFNYNFNTWQESLSNYISSILETPVN